MLGQVQDVDIKLLRVFSVIAKAGGFSAAQAQLNTSQGFISTQMKSLEDRLGTRLCQRGHARFELTESGMAVLKAAETLFEAIDNFRREAESAIDPMLGEVRLGVIDQMATSENCAVSLAISDFAAAAPNASVSLTIVPPMDLETMLLDDRMEMAYGIFHHRLPTLDYEPIADEEHEVYCAASHPLFSASEGDISLNDLQSCEYVGWDYLESGEFLDSPLSSELRAASPYMEAVLHYILSGRYIGYLPSHVGRSWAESGQLRSLCRNEVKRAVSVDLVTRKGVELPTLAETFKKTLFEAHKKLREGRVKV